MRPVNRLCVRTPVLKSGLVRVCFLCVITFPPVSIRMHELVKKLLLSTETEMECDSAYYNSLLKPGRSAEF